MKNQQYNQGFLLPAAIFILVILAGLGAYALNITSLQQSSSTQDVQGIRAYQTALAGVDWAAYQVLAPGTATLANCPASLATYTQNGIKITITCTRYPDYFEQGTDHTIAMYDVTSTASIGTSGTVGYVERQVLVTLSKCVGTDAATPYQCS